MVLLRNAQADGFHDVGVERQATSSFRLRAVTAASLEFSSWTDIQVQHPIDIHLF